MARTPYTNFHDLNLNWIIERIKTVFTPDNPPPYPVTSVNQKTGAVELKGTDIPVSANDTQTVTNALASKYVKPASGIPASDLAPGVIPDPASVIDDNAGAQVYNKTWSAHKLFQQEADILDLQNDKQDAPASEGTAGQVLGLNSDLEPEWVNMDAEMVQAVDDWLSENITNPSNPPLDRSLSLANACAPADLTGELKNEVDLLNNLLDLEEIRSANAWNPETENNNTKISGAQATYGDLLEDNTYKTSDYIPIEYGDSFRWDYSTNANPTSETLLNRGDTVYRLAEYDENKNCLLVTTVWTPMPYSIANQNTKYIRVTCTKYNTNSITINPTTTAQIYYVPYSITKELERIKSLEIQVDALSKGAENIKIMIPDHIYGVVGRPFSIYYYQIFQIDNIENYHVSSGGSTEAENLGNRVRFACTTTGTYTINFRLRRNNNYNIVEKKVTVHIIPDNIPTIKSIFIGDSFVDGGKMQAELKHLMGSALSFYGTRTSSTTDSVGVTQTIRDEGRSNWSLTDYCTLDSKGNVPNAFWDGSAFNFSYYIAQHTEFSDVTDVFIMSGPNDNSNDDTAFKTYYQEIVNSIKTYNNSIRIHCMIPLTANCLGYSWGIRNYGSGETYRYNMFTFGQDIIDLFTNEASCFVVPTHIYFDRFTDFPLTQVPANDRTPTLVTVYADNVHPNEYGYYCMADVIYGHIVAHC